MRHALAALCLAASALAADFQTKPAQDAAAAYQRDVSKAREEYEAALASARSAYGKALDEAAKAAANAGNLDEVVLIQGEKGAIVESRELWAHKEGYFERLHDGRWVECIDHSTIVGFTVAAQTADYVELVREGASVRLFSDHSEVHFHQEPSFRRLHTGEWKFTPPESTSAEQ